MERAKPDLETIQFLTFRRIKGSTGCQTLVASQIHLNLMSSLKYTLVTKKILREINGVVRVSYTEAKKVMN